MNELNAVDMYFKRKEYKSKHLREAFAAYKLLPREDQNRISSLCELFLINLSIARRKRGLNDRLTIGIGSALELIMKVGRAIYKEFA